jgi:hypothetical protein
VNGRDNLRNLQTILRDNTATYIEETCEDVTWMHLPQERVNGGLL